jgi:hypothetical protein
VIQDFKVSEVNYVRLTAASFLLKNNKNLRNMRFSNVMWQFSLRKCKRVSMKNGRTLLYIPDAEMWYDCPNCLRQYFKVLHRIRKLTVAPTGGTQSTQQRFATIVARRFAFSAVNASAGRQKARQAEQDGARAYLDVVTRAGRWRRVAGSRGEVEIVESRHEPVPDEEQQLASLVRARARQIIIIIVR